MFHQFTRTLQPNAHDAGQGGDLLKQAMTLAQVDARRAHHNVLVAEPEPMVGGRQALGAESLRFTAGVGRAVRMHRGQQCIIQHHQLERRGSPPMCSCRELLEGRYHIRVLQ